MRQSKCSTCSLISGRRSLPDSNCYFGVIVPAPTAVCILGQREPLLRLFVVYITEGYQKRDYASEGSRDVRTLIDRDFVSHQTIAYSSKYS